MALLELLARPAPARVVAADLLALVHVAGLDMRQELGGIVIGELHARRRGTTGCGRRGQCAWLVLRRAARVAEVARGARVGAGGPGTVWRLLLRAVAVLALDLHLDAEDVARELLPDRVHQRAEHLEALVLVGHERV